MKKGRGKRKRENKGGGWTRRHVSYIVNPKKIRKRRGEEKKKEGALNKQSTDEYNNIYIALAARGSRNTKKKGKRKGGRKGREKGKGNRGRHTPRGISLCYIDFFRIFAPFQEEKGEGKRGEKKRGGGRLRGRGFNSILYLKGKSVKRGEKKKGEEKRRC